MDCREIQPLLSQMSDGAVTPDTAARIEAHLAECEACRSLLRELKQTKALVANLPQESVSSQFMDTLRREMRVLRHVEQAERGLLQKVWDWMVGPAWAPAPLRRFAAAAVFVLLLLAAAWLVLPRAQHPPTVGFGPADASDSYYYLLAEGHQCAQEAQPLSGGGYIPITEYQGTW